MDFRKPGEPVTVGRVMIWIAFLALLLPPAIWLVRFLMYLPHIMDPPPEPWTR